MASKALKGLTIKIGGDTSELTKALNDVEKKSRSLSSELGQINKLLKLDPQNTELLAQKQKVLADAISNTEKKLDMLREAEKQVQEQFERGEVSEQQYRALQREIIETENKLDRYKTAAKDAAEASEQLAKGADEAAGELDDQADKSQEAERAADDLDDSATDLANGGLALMAAAAAAVVTAIVAMAEASREYRTEMGKLETAFTNAGHTARAATKTYEELQGVLGETDQAVEAANHLAMLCDSEEELAKWTEIATGVYAVFGASLPIEGLAEAANETARVGQLTGPLTDAINWASEAGADFGVVLKENIEFTKLSEKELKKLTDSQREEYEARKEQHDAIEAYNKRVEEAVSAEDKFNIALENCTNEQERQQLIMDTLSGLYKEAAVQYKTANKELIRANQATEKWNKAMAKVGKTVEPVLTDIKELGAALLEDAAEPLQDIADYIQSDVLPAVKDFGNWIKTNLPLIKSLLVGAAAAWAAYQVAVVAANVAHNGLKGAIMATTVAEKALQLVQAATPWGLIATAVAGVAVAVSAYGIAMHDAKKPADVLTEAERELMRAADEAAQAFRDLQKATDDNISGIQAESKHVSDLAGELQGLVTETGLVHEKDKERVQFILNELNEALGTEYELVGNMISQYADLKTSIDDVIQSKLANALLEAGNAEYIAAIQGENEALEGMNLAYKAYDNQLGITQEKEAVYLDAKEAWSQAVQSADEQAIEWANWRLLEAQIAYEEEAGILADTKAEYDAAAQNYANHYNTIVNYEDAQTAALQGNYEKTVDILSNKGETYSNFTDTVDEETARALDILHKEAIDAGLEAERTKTNFENGVDGYTDQMVKEAEEDYAAAMSKFEGAYADAYSAGSDMTAGMTDGAESGRASLIEKARSLVSSFLAAVKEAADVNSPSKKTMAIFEDIGEGAEIGVENKTPDVVRAGKKQTTALLGAYREQEVDAQKSLRNIAEQGTVRQAAGQFTAATANSGLLEQILGTLKEGQILVLDGNAVVGGTANRMDSKLGQLRVLAARGAR